MLFSIELILIYCEGKNAQEFVIKTENYEIIFQIMEELIPFFGLVSKGHLVISI